MTYQFIGLRFDHSVDDIAKFIASEDKKFNGLLGNSISYPRVVSLYDFNQTLQHLNISEQEHVGIFSGSLHEPELKFLNAQQVSLLNFDENALYDLDKSWEEQNSMNFSFSICNQVLEHVFNPGIALKNIIHHTRPGGYIYISIPTINCIHSEPHFYSSGFHPRYLERLAREKNLIPLTIDHWGSFKYMINAVSGKWLSSKQLKPGVHGLRDLLMPFSIFQDGRKNSGRYITDCWGLFQKPEETLS